MTIAVGQIGIYSNILSATPFSTAATASPTSTGSGFIVAVAITNDAITVNSVTDTFSNTYTRLTPIIDTSSGVGNTAFERWYCANGTGGASHQATVTLSGSNGVFAALIEAKGAAPTNGSFYGAANDTFYIFPTSSPYSTSLIVTPPATGALLISCFIGASTTGAASSPTLSESSGFTIIGQTNSQAGGIVPAIGYRAVTGSATYTPNWTMATPAGVAGDVTIDSFFGPNTANTAPLAWII
jgi:hypothetical protein